MDSTQVGTVLDAPIEAQTPTVRQKVSIKPPPGFDEVVPTIALVGDRKRPRPLPDDWDTWNDDASRAWPRDVEEEATGRPDNLEASQLNALGVPLDAQWFVKDWRVYQPCRGSKDSPDCTVCGCVNKGSWECIYMYCSAHCTDTECPRHTLSKKVAMNPVPRHQKVRFRGKRSRKTYIDFRSGGGRSSSTL